MNDADWQLFVINNCCLVIAYCLGWLRGQMIGYPWDKRSWRAVPQRGLEYGYGNVSAKCPGCGCAKVCECVPQKGNV